MECLWGLAQAYQKIKAYKDVLIYCDQIIQMQNIESNFLARVLNLKGEAFYSSALLMAYPKKETAKLYAAESAFREALKNNPYLALAHYNLGLTLVYLDKVDEGIGELSLYVSKVDPATAEKVKKLIDNPQRIVENFAPEFSSVTSDGSYITLDELRGKVLLLDFWGTWCGPCIAALPSLMKVAKNFSKEDFMLISIDTGDERAQWLDFITKNKMNWTQLFDENSKIRNAFKINSFPSYILIDHEGIIRYQTKGYSDRKENEIISAVKNCLKSRDKSSSRAKPVKAEEKSGMKSN
jgi:thiol-disulfide isomerase/thioredoxin